MEDSTTNRHDPIVQELLQALQSDDEDDRERATTELWRMWFYQKGSYGFRQIQQGQALLETGEYTKAEILFTEILEALPDFAEAWNRRAVLYYVQERYSKSLADCQQVIALNPIHFGAWHGLGLCYVALGQYSSAIRAFRRALELQPHSLTNRKLLLECTVRLS